MITFDENGYVKDIDTKYSISLQYPYRAYNGKVKYNKVMSFHKYDQKLYNLTNKLHCCKIPFLIRTSEIDYIVNDGEIIMKASYISVYSQMNIFSNLLTSEAENLFKLMESI